MVVNGKLLRIVFREVSSMGGGGGGRIMVGFSWASQCGLICFQ